jgi:hypothetical protein
MNKTALIPTAVAAVVCTLCFAMAQQPAAPSNAADVAQQSQPAIPTAINVLGRYQAIAIGEAGRFLLVDTHTGQCWERYVTSKHWRDLGSPVAVAKE